MEYTFRKLDANDIAPMCRVISKVGINEFTKVFNSEVLLKLLRGQTKKEAITDIAGLQVVLEIANTIISHIPDCENEIFALLAGVSGLTVDEIRSADLAAFAKMIIEFVKKEEFRDFIGVVSKSFK